MGQDEYRGEVFCDIKVWRNGGEYNGGKNQKYEEGSGGLMPDV